MDERVLIERLTTLKKAETRKAAVALGIPFVHAEILEYLATCNKYSDTPLALVDYLGQTKGTISQSLLKMEANSLIKKTPKLRDKRSVRLALTKKGESYYQKLQSAIPSLAPLKQSTAEELVEVLRALQAKRGLKGFSTCITCRYNQKKSDVSFHCGLTGEALTSEDTRKICREHEFAVG